ncbi:528_t:CDS:2, partial [Diversispora eburnea]
MDAGTVYTANWKKGPTDTWDEVEKKYVAKRELVKVALISVGKTPAAFLKELKLHYNARKKNGLIVRLFGATRETVTGQLMMIAETCEWDLRHYVSHHYAKLSWSHKIGILYSIACALESMHENERIHRDLNSTNNQTFKSHLEIPINQLSLGDIDTPDCYIRLMKNCWSSNQDKRPLASELVKTLEQWHLYKKHFNQFDEAEKIRVKDMKTKGLNTTGKLIAPQKTHPQAIYVSRRLKFPIFPPDNVRNQKGLSSFLVKESAEK